MLLQKNLERKNNINFGKTNLTGFRNLSGLTLQQIP
jgi:hypothetical protein